MLQLRGVLEDITYEILSILTVVISFQLANISAQLTTRNLYARDKDRVDCLLLREGGAAYFL